MLRISSQILSDSRHNRIIMRLMSVCPPLSRKIRWTEVAGRGTNGSGSGTGLSWAEWLRGRGWGKWKYQLLHSFSLHGSGVNRHREQQRRKGVALAASAAMGLYSFSGSLHRNNWPACRQRSLCNCSTVEYMNKH